MTHRRVFHSLLFLLAPALGTATLSGCEGCPTIAGSGIQVEVRDRQTGAYLATTPRGVAWEGTYQDSLRAPGNLPPEVTSLIGAVDRPGRYVVEIEADGYQPWDTAGVQVGEDHCGVGTASFTAALLAAP
jgi:hypothetical protein